MRQYLHYSMLGLLLSASQIKAAESGKALLESNCGRCHAVPIGAASPLKEAPNLKTVLGSYPLERLEFELGEGIGSRHIQMPQIQFTHEQIENIKTYVIAE